MRDRTIQAAERHGILDRLKDFEAALLKIGYIEDVDFDVDNYDEIPHVILIPHYVIPPETPRYFSVRQNTLNSIRILCGEYDLWPSGDAVEDMGEHWYIVRRIGSTWPRKSNAASQIQEPQKCEIP